MGVRGEDELGRDHLATVRLWGFARMRGGLQVDWHREHPSRGSMEASWEQSGCEAHSQALFLFLVPAPTPPGTQKTQYGFQPNF